MPTPSLIIHIAVRIAFVIWTEKSYLFPEANNQNSENKQGEE